MRRLCAVACLLTAIGGSGCTGRLMWVPYADNSAPADGSCLPSDSAVQCAEPVHLGAPSCPKEEAPHPRRTVFVRGPQQKIVIERECEQPKKEAAPQRAPQRAPERQPEAVPGAAQDVILVPRTVYVPYVAQTPTRAARLVTPAAAVQQPPAPEQAPQLAPPTEAPKKEEAPKVSAPAAAPPCPTECPPTTIIEIRQMNERIDRLHRILERLCAPGHRP